MKDLSLIFDKKKSIQHISLADALKVSLIQKKSPVYKFFNKYIPENLKDMFKLVIYAGSEMIGPSIQVAELAGSIAEEMKCVNGKYDEKKPFHFLDIFSGSSSTTIPTLKKFENSGKYINVFRIDASIPEKDNDYIVRLFECSEFIKYQDKDNNPYYKNIDVFKKIEEGNLNEILEKNHYDLCVADPPHYLTLDFLIGKSVKNTDAESMVKLLAKKVGVFIIYYAHKEQVHLCNQIRYELSKGFKYVYKVIVGSEEIAVCCDNSIHIPQVEKGLEEFKNTYKTIYDKELNISWDLNFSEKTSKKGIILAISGSHNDVIIDEIIEGKGSGNTNAESGTTDTDSVKKELFWVKINEDQSNNCHCVSADEFEYRVNNNEFVTWSVDKKIGLLLHPVLEKINKGIDVILNVSLIDKKGVENLIGDESLKDVEKIFISLNNKLKSYEVNNFTLVNFNIGDSEEEKAFAQEQIIQYIKGIQKKKNKEPGKDVYSATKAFKYFYKVVEEEKNDLFEFIKGNIPPALNQNISYLDIGAGPGIFAKRIIKEYDVKESYMIEPSTKLLKLSNFNSDQKIIPIFKEWESVLEEELDNNKFKLITSFNVNYSAWEFSLQKINLCLDDKGWFVMTILDPECEYAKSTNEIKKDIFQKDRDSDTEISTIEGYLNSYFDEITERKITVKVPFHLTLKNHDNYIFKYMFGKWMDELDNEMWKKLQDLLGKKKEDTGGYVLNAEHHLYFCKKKEFVNT